MNAHGDRQKEEPFAAAGGSLNESTVTIPLGAVLVCGALIVSGAIAHATPETLAREAARASCLIDANRVIKISSATQGTLSKVQFKRGAAVKAGDMVAQLESEVEIAQYEAAKLKAESDVIVKSKRAELELAELKLSQLKQLIATNSTPMQKYEEAQTAAVLARLAHDQAIYERKIAELDAKRLAAVIERRQIRSPVDGVITKIDLHEGEYADPATPFGTIAEIRPLLVEIYLPVDVYTDVAIGMPVTIKPRDPIGGSYVLKVISKDPIIDSASGTFQVTASLPNVDGSIPAGIRCNVQF
jgi:RND family efflux transporter MFP subunit